MACSSCRSSTSRFSLSTRFRRVSGLFADFALGRDPQVLPAVTQREAFLFLFFLAPFVFCGGLRPVLGRVFLPERSVMNHLPLMEGRVCVRSVRFTLTPPAGGRGGLACNQEPRPTKLPDCSGSRA